MLLNFYSFNRLLSCPFCQGHQLEKADLLKDTVVRILHKFLICLGDLARYQTEYDPHGSLRLASKYYQMSLILVPASGMPLNQLGTLCSGENYSCDATYYYMYCLACVEPFASARANLKLLFVKNRKRYIEMRAKTAEPTEASSPEDQRVKEIKKFLVLFLYVIEVTLGQSACWSADNSTGESIDNLRLQELCQLCLQEFNSCMFYARNCDSNTGELGFLPDDLVFKLTLIILMTIEQLKNKRANSSSTGKSQLGIYFTCVAFALLFFSHILNHACMRLQADLTTSARLSQLSVPDEEETEVQTETDHHAREGVQSEESQTKTDMTPKKKKMDRERAKKKISLLYARRRFIGPFFFYNWPLFYEYTTNVFNRLCFIR